MEESPCRVSFKMDENTPVVVEKLKLKNDGDFVVTGCIRWIGGFLVKEIFGSPIVNSPGARARTLHEGVLMETTGHMSITVWG